MTPSEPIIALMARFYEELRGIEEEYRLLAGAHDFRPRIEHFHDAVRALTSEELGAREPGGRLSVEWLAYDLSCLRYLQSMPLASFKPHGEPLSPATDMVALDGNLTVSARRPDRLTRERISELYQHYGVLFSALFKPFADRDYKSRVDDLNQDIAEINGIAGQLTQLGQKKGSANATIAAIQHLEDDGLRNALLQFMQQQTYKNPNDLQKLTQLLKQQTSRKDKAIAVIDAAHMNYALSQLALFEDSKDMLKKMAGQGMNLVGRFVEEAMAAARREMGR